MILVNAGVVAARLVAGMASVISLNHSIFYSLYNGKIKHNTALLKRIDPLSKDNGHGLPGELPLRTLDRGVLT